MYKWKSKTLSPKQMAALIFPGGFIGAFLITVVQRAIMDTWQIIEGMPVLNLLVVYLLGSGLSAAYYGGDYRKFNNATLTLDGDALRFYKGNKIKYDITFMELKTFNVSRIAYNIHGLYKVSLSFKSKDDFRRYTMAILIDKNEEDEFVKLLDEGIKRAMKHRSTRVTPKE